MPTLPSYSYSDYKDMTFPCLKQQGDLPSIKIIYRDRIKVHYSSVAQAQSDGYSEFDSKLDVSKGGVVYPFTGLRGDAKELYRSIMKRKEKSVRLVQANNIEEQKQEISSSHIVIFAFGYESHGVPILDA